MPLKQTVSEKLDDLQDNMIKVLQVIGAMSQDITILTQDVSGLKQDVSGLKQDVSGLKQDVSGLKQDVSKLSAEFSHLDKKFDILADTFLAHEVKSDKRLRVVETKLGVYHA